MIMEQQGAKQDQLKTIKIIKQNFANSMSGLGHLSVTDDKKKTEAEALKENLPWGPQ